MSKSSPMKKVADRRKNPRWSEMIDWRRKPRWSEVVLITCTIEGRPQKELFYTKHINQNGLIFECVEPFSLKARMRIDFYVPIDRNKRVMEHVEAQAQVRWVREIPESERMEGSNRYQVGVHFVGFRGRSLTDIGGAEARARPAGRLSRIRRR